MLLIVALTLKTTLIAAESGLRLHDCRHISFDVFPAADARILSPVELEHYMPYPLLINAAVL